MDRERLASQLAETCQLFVLDTATSTNDEAVRRAWECERPLSSPIVVVSSKQSAGKGRLGRSWASPEGGIYLSVLFEEELATATAKILESNCDNGAFVSSNPSISGGSLAVLSPLVALAVRNALQCFCTDEVLLKWPNDVLTLKGKLAGILIESKQALASSFDPTDNSQPRVQDGMLTSSQFVVIGIGTNVNRPVTGTDENAAYLNDGSGRQLSLENVATVVINSLFSQYAAWRADGCFSQTHVTDYLSHMTQLGKQVCVSNALGNEIASGVVEGIDNQGRLLLSTAFGTETIAAGEITLRKQY